MSKVRNFSIFAAVLFVLAACGGESKRAASNLAPVQARVATAERIDSPAEVQLPGTVEARTTAAVSSRIMAQVTRVPVKLGEEVRAGQVLVEIDPTAARGQLNQARGALAQAEAAYRLAERNYKRFEALATNKSASELELDQARMNRDRAAGAREQARGAVAAAASLAGDSRLKAPFSGQVSAKLVDVGDLAAPGRPLVTIESRDGARFVFSLPEQIRIESRIAVGDTVAVEVDSRSDLGRLSAKVGEISAGADPASHSFTVKLDLPETDIASGASGRVWIKLAARPTVVVPSAALLRQGGLDMVVVRDAAGKAEPRVVSLGRRFPDGRTEVLAGLSGGESVLVGLPLS
ncbi:MAG TPA: efflux RND transporter periplasmic adaptor subunit, partial [Thermoanaerobaculia bacterium]|nr:efflux RND transporter periplasmic adaptor subunit [Thermoanaerobaculia bacterium]